MIKRELELAKTSSNLSASYTKKPCTVDDHQAKTIKVFAAGEYFLPPIRVNVCSKRYRSIDALFDEITARIPTLNYGARKLVSAEDKTLITDIEQLQNNGRYLCSDKADVNKIPSFDWDLYEKRIKHQQNFKTHFPPISSFDQFNKKHPTPKRYMPRASSHNNYQNSNDSSINLNKRKTKQFCSSGPNLSKTYKQQLLTNNKNIPLISSLEKFNLSSLPSIEIQLPKTLHHQRPATTDSCFEVESLDQDSKAIKLPNISETSIEIVPKLLLASLEEDDETFQTLTNNNESNKTNFQLSHQLLPQSMQNNNTAPQKLVAGCGLPLIF